VVTLIILFGRIFNPAVADIGICNSAIQYRIANASTLLLADSCAPVGAQAAKTEVKSARTGSSPMAMPAIRKAAHQSIGCWTIIGVEYSY